MMIKVISYIFVVLFVVGVSADGLNNGEACQLCIDIVSAIEDFLTNGATQDDIIAWAEQVYHPYEFMAIQIIASTKCFLIISFD